MADDEDCSFVLRKCSLKLVLRIHIQMVRRLVEKQNVGLPVHKLAEADLRLLQEAGDVLGRYDGESQRQALEGLLRGLEGQAAEAAETARRLCRVYLALGLAAGLFCLILL